MRESELSKKNIWIKSIFQALLIGYSHAWFSGLSKRLDIAAGDWDTPKIVRDANLQEQMPDVILNAVIQGIIIAAVLYLVIVGIKFMIKRKREQEES